MKVSTIFFKKGFLVCSILLASVFLLPKYALATSDVDNVFCNNIGTSHCFATKSEIVPGQARQNEAFMDIKLIMEGDEAVGATKDDTNANNVKGVVTGGAHPEVDDEDNLGGWNSIWDEHLESSATNGIILDVGTMINGSTTPDVNTVNNGIQSATNGIAFTPGYISGGTGISSPLPGIGGSNGHLYIHGYTGLQLRDSGKMLLLNNNINIPIKISGLTAGTTYYARLIFFQNGGMGTIASTRIITINTPANGATVFNAQETVNTIEAGTSATVDPQTGLPKCGFISDDSSVLGCVAQIAYYVVFIPTSKIMALTGEIMDWGLGYTIDSKSYPSSGPGFITSGWRIMRDLANMLFIFILLYIAIATILDIGNINTGKMIGTVIVVALLINFSIFFCKVIVDSGNILSRLFYNQIVVTNSNTTNEITGAAGYKSVSFAFADKFNPVKLFDALDADAYRASDPGKFAGAYTLFVVVASFVNILAAYVFFTLAWFFISRTAGIWLAMIFSPIAFLSYALPFKVSLDILGHDRFWKELVRYAFMAPIALIMIFLIITFFKTESLLTHLDLNANPSAISIFMGVVVPLLLISFLLLKTKSITKEMAGKLGDAASGVGSFIGGAAVGLATGGAAMAMRGTFGRAGSALANSSIVKNNETKSGIGGMMARSAASGGKYMATSSFDARNTQAGKLAEKKSGFDFNKNVFAPKAQSGKERGFEKDRKDQIEKDNKRRENTQIKADSAYGLQLKSQFDEAKKAHDTKVKVSDAAATEFAKTQAELERLEKAPGLKTGAVLKEIEDKKAELAAKEAAKIAAENETKSAEEARNSVDIKEINKKRNKEFAENVLGPEKSVGLNFLKTVGGSGLGGAALGTAATAFGVAGGVIPAAVVGGLAYGVGKGVLNALKYSPSAKQVAINNALENKELKNKKDKLLEAVKAYEKEEKEKSGEGEPEEKKEEKKPKETTASYNQNFQGKTGNNVQGMNYKPTNAAGTITQTGNVFQSIKAKQAGNTTEQPQQVIAQQPIFQPIKQPQGNTTQPEQSIDRQTKINSEGPGLRIIQTPTSGKTEVNIQGNAKVNFGGGVGIPKSPDKDYRSTDLGHKPDGKTTTEQIFQNTRSRDQSSEKQTVTTQTADMGDKAAETAKTIGQDDFQARITERMQQKFKAEADQAWGTEKKPDTPPTPVNTTNTDDQINFFNSQGNDENKK